MKQYKKHRRAELTLDADGSLLIDGERIEMIDNGEAVPRITAENFIYIRTKLAFYCLQMTFDYWKTFFSRSEKKFDPAEIIAGKKACLSVGIKKPSYIEIKPFENNN